MALVDSVLAAIGDLDTPDQAAADLALTYAQAIDAGGDLARLGPALLAVLEAMHLTRRSRVAAMKGMGVPAAEKPSSPLDELRARRAARTGA